ncbi:leucine-rich repeat-containing protein 74A [Aplysia californica]|uniref:Leucine-rich repeat-containing protein 74A n=1 Tax=Aplysia californica TaxID=6500 RepID=A0ABM0JB91_APLCA|nr:leucine-rich repeat-containing protein 74A [Aplysia californica]
MEGRKRVLITQAESEGSVSGSSPTQDTAFSDVQEGTRERSTRAGSGTHHSQFSHDSVYSEGRYLEPSERGYDTGDDTGDDTISIVDSRRRNESLYDDVLEEEEEEEEEEDENNDDNNSMEGWDVSQSDSSDDEDESVHELRDSDYDTDLDMNDDKYLHPEKYDHDTTGMAKYLKACKELGLQPIRYFMKHMQDEHLKLRYHGLGPSAMKALAAPLECNTAIEHMDLEGNWIMAEGTVHLCRVLRENVFLTELNLSENKIEDEGATTVCKLLIENRTIERLELAGNNISDHTGEILHELLTVNTILNL